MASQRIDIAKFIQLAPTHLVVDVRSPSEYAHAHYPDAVSLPLFDDDERKEVGTTYKQDSREKAIKVGLDYFGPKMKKMVETVEDLLHKRASKTVIVHCWRGGMRSGAVSWLLALYGFKVYTLDGGYKKFRNWVLDRLAVPYPLQILGGYTGSGKTEILQELIRKGQPAIDLEALAMHRGSAFGGLGLPVQCSTEQFENKLALELFNISSQYPGRNIWIESESRRIGNININHTFFNQMLGASYILLNVPFEERLKYIVKGYGSFDKEELKVNILRIQKRLGGLETKTALQHLEDNDISSCFQILLKYYDKFYNKSNIDFRKDKTVVALPDTNPLQNATAILKYLS